MLKPYRNQSIDLHSDLISECNIGLIRGSRPELLCKKRVVGNFAKFTGKHLYQSLFLNKVTGRRPATLLKKRF